MRFKIAALVLLVSLIFPSQALAINIIEAEPDPWAFLFSRGKSYTIGAAESELVPVQSVKDEVYYFENRFPFPSFRDLNWNLYIVPRNHYMYNDGKLVGVTGLARLNRILLPAAHSYAMTIPSKTLIKLLHPNFYEFIPFDAEGDIDYPETQRLYPEFYQRIHDEGLTDNQDVSAAPYIARSTVAHELGHLVRFKFFTEQDLAEYMELRGIDSSGTNYVNQPEEIFAEDFRYLFGSWDARCYDPYMPTVVGPPGFDEYDWMLDKLVP